jgi:beta-galactosidase/beta-glucuronidase
MVREQWQSLNGLWDFTAGDDRGQILVPFCVESALSGVGKHYDKLTYRRTFEVPADWKGKRVCSTSAPSTMSAASPSTASKLGKHVGGYDAFSFDITDALKGRRSAGAGRRRHRHHRRHAGARQAASRAARHLVHARHRHLANRLA